MALLGVPRLRGDAPSLLWSPSVWTEAAIEEPPNCRWMHLALNTRGASIAFIVVVMSNVQRFLGKQGHSAGRHKWMQKHWHYRALKNDISTKVDAAGGMIDARSTMYLCPS